MNWDTFLGLIRNYAAAALKKRKSYAEPVRHIVALYVASVKEQALPADEEAKRIAAAQSAALREYGREDSTFSLTDAS